MGEVFLARPVGSEQTVALKVLAPDSVPRFEREAELVRQLSHPGLVRVLAHGLPIQVGVVAHAGRGVDTFEDYQEFVRSVTAARTADPARAA